MVPSTVAPTVASTAIRRLSESDWHMSATPQGLVQASVENSFHS